MARSGSAAIGAGLLPIALGYLVAHYLTYLLIDGQRIVIALADPFQQGWALLPTAFHKPSGAWLPPGLVWTVQLAAVVGGHMLGAWGGHVVAAADAPAGITAGALRAARSPSRSSWSGSPRSPCGPSVRRSWSRRRPDPFGGRRLTLRRDRHETRWRRHPVAERANLGEPVGDGRVERLGGGDGRLDRGQAQDPFGDRRQADLGRVADRARSAASAC